MGTDDLFKKRREDRKKRKHGYRMPRANSYLIVTEGTQTEPLYFRGIQKMIQDRLGGNVDIVELPVIDIKGEGCSTEKLIEMTDRIVKRAKILYQNIWVVFDKDDFPDFDQAVMEGADKGYKIAWSNQSFEYWLYLHFSYSDSALYRSEWNEKLDEFFKKYNLGNGRYEKNYVDIYKMLDEFGGVHTAIKNARRRMADFDKEHVRPSEYDPGTTVYQLVEELREYLK